MATQNFLHPNHKVYSFLSLYKHSSHWPSQAAAGYMQTKFSESSSTLHHVCLLYSFPCVIHVVLVTRPGRISASRVLWYVDQVASVYNMEPWDDPYMGMQTGSKSFLKPGPTLKLVLRHARPVGVTYDKYRCGWHIYPEANDLRFSQQPMADVRYNQSQPQIQHSQCQFPTNRRSSPKQLFSEIIYESHNQLF